MVRKKNSALPDDIVKNRLRNSAIEFLGLWEQINNLEFKPVEFDGYENQAGDNALRTCVTYVNKSIHDYLLNIVKE